MRTFIIHWLDNTTSIDDAFMKAGYGSGALSAVDWWKEVK